VKLRMASLAHRTLFLRDSWVQIPPPAPTIKCWNHILNVICSTKVVTHQLCEIVFISKESERQVIKVYKVFYGCHHESVFRKNLYHIHSNATLIVYSKQYICGLGYYNRNLSAAYLTCIVFPLISSESSNLKLKDSKENPITQ
jgi:hypothetical protein